MSRPLRNFDRSLGFLLNDISRLMRQEFNRRVEGFGLTRAQWLFLFYVARRPGCTQSDLAEELQVQKITVSRQADRLERAGWIERRESRADARAYHLYLRPKAVRVVNRLAAIAEQLRGDYLQPVPPGRRETLIDDLLLIKANLQRLAAPKSLSA